MTVVLIILGYLLMGAVIAGLVERFWNSLYEFDDWAILVMFWPLGLLIAIVALAVYPLVLLAKKIADA